MEAAREAASDSHPHVLTADEVVSATAPVVDNARFIDEALQDALPPEMRYKTEEFVYRVDICLRTWVGLT